MEGQKRADNYRIVNTCNAGWANISPWKFIMYNGLHSFIHQMNCTHRLCDCSIASIDISLVTFSEYNEYFALNAQSCICYYVYMNARHIIIIAVTCIVSCSLYCLFSFTTPLKFNGGKTWFRRGKALLCHPPKCLWPQMLYLRIYVYNLVYSCWPIIAYSSIILSIRNRWNYWAQC